MWWIENAEAVQPATQRRRNAATSSPIATSKYDPSRVCHSLEKRLASFLPQLSSRRPS